MISSRLCEGLDCINVGSRSFLMYIDYYSWSHSEGWIDWCPGRTSRFLFLFKHSLGPRRQSDLFWIPRPIVELHFSLLLVLES